MGKITFLILVFILAGAAQEFLWASIVGSAHDFSTAPMPASHGAGEICKVCHTPHNAKSRLVPLWRGNLTGSYTFTLYSSDTLNASLNQPMAPTKACLTCHDGLIAKYPVTGCNSCHYASPGHSYWDVRNLDLSEDHPVSFIFDSSLAQRDGSLHDPNTTPVASLGGKTIKEGMLFQDRLECPSCHDVHKARGDSATAGKLLLVSNANNALCLTCHNK